jgi:LacI family transcriptional regulator
MTTVDSDHFEKLPSVDVDDEGGAVAAAEHLIGLGHRNVLVIAIERAEHAPSGAEDVVARRLRGYRTAFRAAGVEIGDDDVIVSQATFAGGLDAIQRAWLAGRRPTAILAMSDAMAIGAIRGLRDRGLSIPADVSVVGFDDIELSQTTDPPLTTIHQPIRGKGEEAVRLLMALIAGHGQPPEHRRLATELIVRASTAVAPTTQGR